MSFFSGFSSNWYGTCLHVLMSIQYGNLLWRVKKFLVLLAKVLCISHQSWYWYAKNDPVLKIRAGSSCDKETQDVAFSYNMLFQKSWRGAELFGFAFGELYHFRLSFRKSIRCIYILSPLKHELAQYLCWQDPSQWYINSGSKWLVVFEDTSYAAGLGQASPCNFMVIFFCGLPCEHQYILAISPITSISQQEKCLNRDCFDCNAKWKQDDMIIWIENSWRRPIYTFPSSWWTFWRMPKRLK